MSLLKFFFLDACVNVKNGRVWIARASAKATYFPIVVGWNLLYVSVRVGYQWSTWTMVHMMASILLWILTFVSYNGILDQCENAHLLKKKGNTKDTQLEGGAWLDLLGLVVLIQFGTAFISSFFYWFLLILPIWGIYKLYQTFYGTTSNNDDTAAASDEKDTVDETTKEKRKKRAEKRRQKWS